MRYFLVLLCMGISVGLFADPTAAEKALVDRYKSARPSVVGLKPLKTQTNGWTQYPGAGKTSIYDNPKQGATALVLEDETEIYWRDDGSVEFRLPTGRQMTWQKSTGRLTWTPSAGDLAPAFDLAVLDGNKSVSLASLRGSVVLIDFWASWCGPCRQYMPMTQKLAADYGPKGLKVFGLNIEGNDAKARGFVKDLKVTFPVLLAKPGKSGYDWGAVQIADYGVTGIPHAVLIDKKGVIRAVETVFQDTALLEALLAEPGV